MKKLFFIVIGCLVLAVTSVVGIASTDSMSSRRERDALIFDSTEFAQGSSENGANIYLDSNGNKYIFNDQGEQIGFIGRDNGIELLSDNTCEIDLNDAVVISQDLLSNMISNRNYTMTDAQFIDDLGIYSITYHYFVGDLRSSDFVFMFISPKGELMSYAAPNMGVFDSVDVPEIDTSEIEQIVKNYTVETYDCTDCVVSDMTLIKTDNLQLSVSYVITLKDGTFLADEYLIDLN